MFWWYEAVEAIEASDVIKSVEVIGANEVFKTTEVLEINKLMARITLFWCFERKKILNRMMEFQVKFCHHSGLRLWRTGMLFSTKSKCHKSNVRISWMYRYVFYDFKVHFWWPNKRFISRISSLNTLYDSSVFLYHTHSMHTLQMFCLLNPQMNACEPNPKTTSSDFNRWKSVTKIFCFHAISTDICLLF